MKLDEGAPVRTISEEITSNQLLESAHGHHLSPDFARLDSQTNNHPEEIKDFSASALNYFTENVTSTKYYTPVSQFAKTTTLVNLE